MTAINGWIDVKDAFHAHGDGVTDDTTAIQNALASVSSPGAVVYFPPGKYCVKDVLELSNFTTVQGCGPTVSVLCCTVNVGNLLLASSTTNTVISDIGIEFGADLTTGTAIAMVEASVMSINNVVITDPPTVGLLVSGGTGLGSCENIRVEQLVVCAGNPNASAAIRVNGGGSVLNPGMSGGANRQIYFTDCVLIGPPSPGPYPTYGFDLGNCQATKILGCNVSSFDTGLNIYPSSYDLTNPATYSSVYGLWATNSKFTSNRVSGMTINTTQYTRAYQIVIAGCAFAGTTDGPGVSIVGSPDFVLPSGSPLHAIQIAGCMIVSNAQQGIIAQYCDYIQVFGCGIYGNGRCSYDSYDGFDIASAQDVTLSVSCVTGPGAGFAANQKYGLSVDAASSAVMAIGCDLTGNVTAAVAVPATVDFVVKACAGYNPQGLVTPTIPSIFDTPYPSPFPAPATVFFSLFVDGVTVTDVDGTNTSINNPTNGVRVTPGQSILPSADTDISWQWYVE
jgi:Pectate lyase superfamily protein